MDKLVGFLIGVVLVVVGIWLLYMGVGLAGVGLIIVFDRLARAFTWIGVDSPAGGWMLLGTVAGGAVGATIGLRRAGRPASTRKIVTMATVGVLLLFFLGANSHAGTGTAGGSTSAEGANRARAQAFLGEWRGVFGVGRDSRLTITPTGLEVEATLISQRYREMFRAEAAPGGRLFLRPVSVTLANGAPAPTYSLDSVWLTITGNGRSISGSYKDAKGNRGLVTMTR